MSDLTAVFVGPPALLRLYVCVFLYFSFAVVAVEAVDVACLLKFVAQAIVKGDTQLNRRRRTMCVRLLNSTGSVGTGTHTHTHPLRYQTHRRTCDIQKPNKLNSVVN